MKTERKLIPGLIAVILGVTACGDNAAPVTEVQQPADDPAIAATAEITADLMRAHVIELSDDKYEGRGPGAPGDEMARQYLADRPLTNFIESVT